MNFKIKRIKLLNALSKVIKAVSSRSALPALTSIKFELKENELILTGSDSDISIQITVPKDDELEIISSGSVLLSAKYIIEIIRKIDSDYVNIEIVDGLLTRIKGDKTEYNLNGTDIREYPMIDLQKKGSSFKLNASLLKEIVNQTSFAASDKETKPILTGINLVADGSTLQCTATDSYRLAKKVVDLNQDITFNITIPEKSLDDISKIVTDQEELEVYVSDRKALFVLENTIIQTRLIDGNYPDTSRLIPTEEDYSLVLKTSDLLKALDRVSLLTSELSNIILLTMNQSKVVLSSYVQEIGSVEEIIESNSYIGNELSISFSCKYVTEAIRCFNSDDEIKLSFTGEMKPFIIKKLNHEDVIQLVLPVRTY